MNSSLAEAVKAVFPTLILAHRRVLQSLLFAPEHAATASQIRTLLGLPAVAQVNYSIGLVGRKVQEAWCSHPDGLALGKYEWWQVIATGEQIDGRGFLWRLREEVVAGLKDCGLCSNGDTLPNEVMSNEILWEGAARQIRVNAFERNPVARARCIEFYGTVCAICDFDFGKTYGESAMGFIHVHHTKPLASIGIQYEVDPIMDLRPVCPNCHAVIHLVNPPRSIEEMKTLLVKNGRGSLSDRPNC